MLPIDGVEKDNFREREEEEQIAVNQREKEVEDYDLIEYSISPGISVV